MHLKMVHCTAITSHYKPSQFELCSFKLRRDIFATVVVIISLSELGVVSVKGVARQECKECIPTQGKIKFETSVSWYHIQNIVIKLDYRATLKLSVWKKTWSLSGELFLIWCVGNYTCMRSPFSIFISNIRDQAIKHTLCLILCTFISHGLNLHPYVLRLSQDSESSL